MISADLGGRTVLVTGEASGIGLATVTLLGRARARVALNHLPDDPAGPREAERLRGEAIDVVPVAGDVAGPGRSRPPAPRSDGRGRVALAPGHRDPSAPSGDGTPMTTRGCVRPSRR